MEPQEGGVTRLLQQSADGDTAAQDELFQLLLPTLRQMAAARMAREKPGHTLGPTALVNEAFLRLARQYKVPVANTEQFLGVFGLTMRRVLVDHWKKRHAMKEGGSLQRVPIDERSCCRDTTRSCHPPCTSVSSGWNGSGRVQPRSSSTASSADSRTMKSPS